MRLKSQTIVIVSFIYERDCRCKCRGSKYRKPGVLWVMAYNMSGERNLLFVYLPQDLEEKECYFFIYAQVSPTANYMEFAILLADPWLCW